MKNSTFKCKCCGKVCKCSNQTTNTYCSNQCCAKDKKAQSVIKFKAGKVKDRDTIRRVFERLGEYICFSCGLKEWKGKRITLQVDHIDGNAGNNKPNNLRLLCPNCHSQQDNWGAKNKGFGRKSRGLSLR